MSDKKEIFRGRVFSVGIEEHRMPDGRLSHFEIVRHPGAAAVLPLLKDDRIILIRQYRPSIDGMILEIPAGRLEEGETPEQCARREIEEEIGCRVERLSPLGNFYTAVGFSDIYLHLFAAEVTEEGEQALEEDEFIEVLRLPLQEALALLERGEITDAKTVMALLLHTHHCGNG
ncbi:MAG: NUDIX hydrolase [Desulfuromonadaceae bacterium]|nr:NUDIX hydrolase [Desulfuromonadaceae bacterium]